ncbi:paired mesoderm homeobox protein 1 [Trichonephila clavipes]|nr:paired mesoderm homeobox protein 1 [Trichonephila clavipes]
MVDFGTTQYGDNTKRFTVSHLLDLPRNGCCLIPEPTALPQAADLEEGDKTEGTGVKWFIGVNTEDVEEHLEYFHDIWKFLRHYCYETIEQKVRNWFPCVSVY